MFYNSLNFLLKKIEYVFIYIYKNTYPIYMKIKRRFNELELLDIENSDYENEMINIKAPHYKYISYRFNKPRCLRCDTRLCDCSGHSWDVIDCLEDIDIFYKHHNYKLPFINIDNINKFNNPFSYKLINIIETLEHYEHVPDSYNTILELLL